MTKPDLSKLSGYDLFDYYTAQGDEYASVLGQAYVEVGDKLFSMLVECEKTGKKIVIKEDVDDVNDSPVTVTIE